MHKGQDQVNFVEVYITYILLFQVSIVLYKEICDLLYVKYGCNVIL